MSNTCELPYKLAPMTKWRKPGSDVRSLAAACINYGMENKADILLLDVTSLYEIHQRIPYQTPCCCCCCCWYVLHISWSTCAHTNTPNRACLLQIWNNTLFTESLPLYSLLEFLNYSSVHFKLVLIMIILNINTSST